VFAQVDFGAELVAAQHASGGIEEQEIGCAVVER
jgi:hypothetical protein